MLYKDMKERQENRNSHSDVFSPLFHPMELLKQLAFNSTLECRVCVGCNAATHSDAESDAKDSNEGRSASLERSRLNASGQPSN